MYEEKLPVSETLNTGTPEELDLGDQAGVEKENRPNIEVKLLEIDNGMQEARDALAKSYERLGQLLAEVKALRAGK